MFQSVLTTKDPIGVAAVAREFQAKNNYIHSTYATPLDWFFALAHQNKIYTKKNMLQNLFISLNFVCRSFIQTFIFLGLTL